MAEYPNNNNKSPGGQGAMQVAGALTFDSSAWARCLADLQLSDANLLSISSYDSSRRTYTKGEIVYKIALTQESNTDHLRLNSPSEEFEILRRLENVSGVSEAVDFKQGDGWTALLLKYFPGSPVVPHQLQWKDVFLCSWRLAKIGWRLNKRGISHNDLRPPNVLVDASGQILIVDFDQASTSSFRTAFIRTFSGLSTGKAPVFGSVFNVLKKKLGSVLPRSVYRFIRRLQGKNFEVDSLHDLPAITPESSRNIRLVYSAWALAQQSHASSPGQKKAYYSIEFEGVHFPGERPWAERWEVLRGLREYTGLKTLELGCNLALLSGFLLKEGGALKAMAVDTDTAILEAAGNFRSALGVDTLLGQANFDDAGDWENDLLAFGADVVFALSVLNWVRDKDRFLRFLARHRCVIFEGHDDFNTERDRFREVGFEDIRLVAVSERGRPLLICTR